MIRNYLSLPHACRLAIAVTSFCIGHQAYANVSLTQGVWGIDGTSTDYSQTAEIQMENAITDSGSLSYGYTNLETGTLKAYSSSAIGSGGLPTSTQSVLNDNFYFSGPMGGTAFLDWTFSGSLDLNLNKLSLSQSGGAIGLYFADMSSPPAYQEVHALLNFGCNLLVATTCLEGDSINVSGSIPISIHSGEYFFQAWLSAWATEGDIAEFSNSAHISMRLPDGVTMQSRSGVFLTQNEPNNQVPEPGSLALLGLGLACLFNRPRSDNRRLAICSQVNK